MAEKECSECGTSKSLEEFYYHKKTNKPYARCKRCHLDRTSRRFRENPDLRAEASWRQRGISITWEQFEQMDREQDSRCKICGKTCGSGRRLSVDHNHETGEVRGLLCLSCNQFIGKIENGTVPLERVLTYLGVTHHGT